MKKVVCLLLALCIIFSCTACCQRTTEKCTEVPEEKILMNWNRYLQICEAKYSAIQWAAEYLAEFAISPDLTTCRRAISAAESVGAILDKIEIPAFDITTQDIENALLCGIDISYLNMEFSSAAAGLNTSALTWQAIARDILTEGFWKYGIEYLEKTAQLQLAEAKINAEYLRLTTNYLLLSLGKTSFDAKMQTEYPTLFPQDTTFIDSIAQTENEVSCCLDELENLISSYSELSGIHTANNLIFEDALLRNDYSEIHNETIMWKEDCFLIPCPTWDSLPAVFSYSTRKNGEIEWTNMGADLSTYPDGLILQYDNISKTDFSLYLNILENTGITCTTFTGNLSDAEACQYIFSDGKNNFAVNWNNNTATLYITQRSAHFCPLWYKLYISENTD